METKKSSRGFTILRAKGIIDYPAIDVWRAYEHADLQKEFNSNLAESRWLKKIGTNAFIGYQAVKGMLGFQARDFVFKELLNIEADGQIILVATSNELGYEHPEVKGIIRADIPITGLIFKAISKTQTHVTYITEVDLKTSIPQWVLRVALKDEGKQISGLRDILPKFKKMNI